MPKHSRASYKGCSVVQEGKTLVLRWRSVDDTGERHRPRQPTGLAATDENRRIAEGWAKLVGDLVKAGTDPLPTLRKHFAEVRAAQAASAELPHTVQSWYDRWTMLLSERNVPKYRLDDYEKHLETYILPAHGALLLSTVGDHLEDFRHALLHQPLTDHAVKRRRKRAEEGEGEARSTLGVKTVKNIFASYRAMLRDAVEEKILDVNPFVGRRFRWEDYERDDDEAEPDPFTEDERDRLLDYFKMKAWKIHNQRRGVWRPFYGYLFACFWTGMRPSEVSGLKWSHVDLAAETARVRHRYRGRLYGKKLKTKNAKRTVELHPTLCAILREIRPAKLHPHGFVFTNLRGEPIRPGAFSELWYDALRTLNPPIRPRGLYQTKHTFCSLTVSSGDLNKLLWLEKQTGEPWETLRRHYATFFPTPPEERTTFRDLDPSLAKGAKR